MKKDQTLSNRWREKQRIKEEERKQEEEKAFKKFFNKVTTFFARRVIEVKHADPYSKPLKEIKCPKAKAAFEKRYTGKRTKQLMDSINPKRHKGESFEDYKKRKVKMNKRIRERGKRAA